MFLNLTLELMTINLNKYGLPIHKYKNELGFGTNYKDVLTNIISMSRWHLLQ